MQIKVEPAIRSENCEFLSGRCGTMAPQSILAVLAGEGRDRVVLDTTLDVSDPETAEITVLYVKPDPQLAIPLLGDGLSGAMAGEVIAAIERDAEIRAKEARSAVELWSREMGIPIATTAESFAAEPKRMVVWRELVGREDDAAAYLGRNADLIVLARQEDMPGMGTIEACLFNSGRPVLLAPSEKRGKLGRHVGILWNGSSQAARAVAEAMPLLRSAGKVTIYTTGAEGPAPSAGDLGRRLSRMGITTMVDLVRQNGRSAGEVLMDAAERDEVDLIVMGAYGHGRFQELILGGVTRLALETSRIAALLSH